MEIFSMHHGKALQIFPLCLEKFWKYSLNIMEKGRDGGKDISNDLWRDISLLKIK
jgi:hypothetical protein